VHGTLGASNIVKAHGPQLVLRGVSLTVQPGSRIGVVGPNGIGKTTLLRVLAGLEATDRGVVARVPESLTVGYLPQEYESRPGETLLGFLARRTGVAGAEAEMDALAAGLAAQPDLAEAYSEALERFLSLGGADLAARARAACAEVGLEPSLDVPLTTLSGGEAARAALAGFSSPVSTFTSSTSRRTTSTSRDSSGSSGSSTPSRAGSSQSPTTARSSTAR
jgi:ATPase subunit of ABC transporter with duplicated ATPase domains